MEHIKNAWSRHGWKMFGPVALLNIKHRFKILLSPGKFDAKSSVDNIPGVETNKSVYLSALGYTHEYGAGGNAYEPIDEDKFITAIRSLPIDPSKFCFVDLGSGKGAPRRFVWKKPRQSPFAQPSVDQKKDENWHDSRNGDRGIVHHGTGPAAAVGSGAGAA